MKRDIFLRLACMLVICLAFPTVLSAQLQWPHPIPARIGDGPNKDLFIMTLGNVQTSIADGTFDPVKDEIRLKDGRVLPNYYRDNLGVKYYKPIDKKVFPLPPSGLCTWYYYYQDINEQEVRRNTDWIAGNLKEYGARYIQIDDGWQAERQNGKHGSRDWTGVDTAFPGGMANLAKYIKSKGLIPGIWIAPHGQSNEAVVKKHPGVFLLKPDGTSASKTWEGDWLVDGSSEEGNAYLKDLFILMAGWGYDYFKIDGQPIVPEEYAKNKELMKHPGEADEVYRKTLETIREAIGPNRYLLGCWGLPVEGAGIMDGTRTGGDVVLGWAGFMGALSPTMESYWQHNILWYTDPDVMLLRAPLTLEQARVWATLQGLTGQALMGSDRLMDLSDDRVELMKRVYPAVDIRPLDLFPSRRNKRIWDLKVNHLGRDYDVVGLFNFDENQSDLIHLTWKDLGLTESGPVQVFDFWNNEYLGSWEAGIALDILPTSCRVLTLIPDRGHIQLISTNRHITQGWIDLVSLEYQDNAKIISGKSHVIGNDPYQLAFSYPRGEYFKVERIKVKGERKEIRVKVINHQGWSTVRIESPVSGEVEWEVAFEPAEHYKYITRDPGRATVRRVGLDGVNLSWSPQYYLNSGYQVYLDRVLLGYTPGCSFPLRNLDPYKTYEVDVRTVWDDGTINDRPATASPGQREPGARFILSDMLPGEYKLTDIGPMVEPWFKMDRPFTFNGTKYENTIFGWMNTASDYEIKGLFSRFNAITGVDDATGEGSASTTVEFIVSGDGKELWRSGPVKKSDPAKMVDIPVTGVKILSLKVEGPEQRGFGRGGVIVGWVNAVVKR
ncbi:MAG: NPCBM/NEW2 domain-containing protein [Bacteroidota bacterium]